MQLVHRGQVLAGLSIALESRLFKLNLLWHFLSFLLVDHLENRPLSIFDLSNHNPPEQSSGHNALAKVCQRECTARHTQW